MNRNERLGLALLLFLGWLATTYAVDIVEHFQRGGRLRVELGRARLTRLDAATVERLESLSSKLFVTYYVSPVEEMPSSMRHVERQVTDLLEALKARAPGRFDFQIVDPETVPELAGFASRRKVAPFRVRSFAHDSYTERIVWSTLTLAYGAYPEAILAGIGPAEVPVLQRRIVATLDQLEEPRRPVIVVAETPGFQQLEETLAERGELVRVRLDEGELPPEADLLVWMRPRRVRDEVLTALDRFLERGGSVLVAGGRLAADSRSLVDSDDGAALQLFESGQALGELLPHFGLQPRPGLFLDERCDTLEFQGEEVRAPFLVRCIAPNQDFHSFPTLPNGTLLFTAPTPFTLDDETLRERGWNAEVLATTSETTWAELEPIPPAPPLPLAAMVLDQARAVPKQPLIVGLRHDQPSRGRLIACAQTTPFEDGMFRRENVAHPRLLASILAETLADERLVVTQAHVERAPPLPPMGRTARLFWRVVCVFLLPGVLLALLLRRGLPARKALPAGPTGSGRRLAAGVAVLAGVLACVRVADAWAPRIDATSTGANALAPETRAIAERAGAAGTIAAELVLSERSVLPPELHRPVEELNRLLDDLEDAGADLELTRVLPGEQDDEERERTSFRLSTSEGDVTTVRRFHASLALTLDGRTETIPFPDVRAFEELEFRVAFALWKLAAKRRPHVAFASDVPRLSAAEAYEQYQQKGLFAPKGTDVYSLARWSLERAGYRVTHVDPSRPEVPDDVDLLIWMQPRRSTEPMLRAMLHHLLRGGRVLLAAQYFNILSQQYRGADFEMRYWPRPQTPDVDKLYFPELGIELVREVLFDELHTTMETEVEIVGRGPGRDYEVQTSALPFLIRASAADYAAGSPFTRNLGDQAFVWGNFLRWDEGRLAELGLTAHPLIFTSERTWTYPWKGGYVTDAELRRPPEEELLGELPLAVLFEGAFPAPEGPLQLGQAPPAEDAEEEPREDWPTPQPGRLLFFGGSELFKNHRLLEPEFRADQLLRNAAAALALEPELARIASKRRVAPGIGYLEPATKRAWRAVVVGAGPLLLVVAGGVAALLRRRPLAWRRLA